MSNSFTVIVAGMHRSGTSALAGVLAKMGASVGASDELMPPKADNPKGFFERLDVFALHERVFSELGCDWQTVHRFVRPDAESVDWGALQDRFDEPMRHIVDSLPAGPIRVLKDPRFSVLLPMWENALGSHVVLNAVRHPTAVAQSLTRRDALSEPLGLALWETYNLALLQNARAPVFGVSYETLVSQPERQLRRLISLISSCDASAAEALKIPSAEGFLATSLDNSVKSRGCAWTEVVQLSATLTGACKGESPMTSPYPEELSALSLCILDDRLENRRREREGRDQAEKERQEVREHIKSLGIELLTCKSELNRQAEFNVGLAAQQKTELAQTVAAQEARNEQLRAGHQTELGAMAKEHEAALETMAKDHHASLGSMANDHEARLGAMAQDHEAQLGTMTQDHEAQLGTMTQDHEAQLGTMAQDHEARLGTMAQDHEARLGAMAKDHSDERTALVEAHREERQGFGADIEWLKAQVENVRGGREHALELGRGLKEDKTQLESRVSSLEESLERALVVVKQLESSRAVRLARTLNRLVGRL